MTTRPLPNNPDVCKVTMLYGRDTRVFVNTFHVAHVGGWTVSTMAALCGAFKTWWENYYKLAVPSGIALTQIQARLLDPSLPLAVDDTTGMPSSGGQSGNMEAANVTNTLSWRTFLAGKRYRGRTYIPGMLEAQVSQGDQLLSAQSVLEATAANALINAVLTGVGNLVLFHNPDVTPSVFDNTFQAITTFVIENILDSQRRRLPGRGR